MKELVVVCAQPALPASGPKARAGNFPNAAVVLGRQTSWLALFAGLQPDVAGVFAHVARVLAHQSGLLAQVAGVPGVRVGGPGGRVGRDAQLLARLARVLAVPGVKTGGSLVRRQRIARTEAQRKMTNEKK